MAGENFYPYIRGEEWKAQRFSDLPGVNTDGEIGLPVQCSVECVFQPPEEGNYHQLIQLACLNGPVCHPCTYSLSCTYHTLYNQMYPLQK